MNPNAGESKIARVREPQEDIDDAVRTVMDAVEGRFSENLCLGTSPEFTDAVNTLLDRTQSLRLEVEYQTRKANLLGQLSFLLRSDSGSQDIVHTVVRMSAGVLGDMCAIFLYNEDSPEPEACAAYHTNPARSIALTEIIGKHPGRADRGLVGQVMASGKPVLIKDAANLQRFYANVPVYRELKMRSVLAVPLAVGNRYRRCMRQRPRCRLPHCDG